MIVNPDHLALQQGLVDASQNNTPIKFIAGCSKDFYGYPAIGKEFDISNNHGIINYQPSELVVTARAGTSLKELEELLASERQMLGFEPPHFARNATVGGAIATGLSGPRRAFSGSARDFILGCKIINGKGEILSFGGEVMKNVAGYDVSRLMVGALGTLGLILEVSLKVLPLPINERTMSYTINPVTALSKMIQWRRQYLPLSAMCFDGKSLLVRFSGTESVIQSAITKLGGEGQMVSNDFWRQLNEQKLHFFQTTENIWRISVPPATPLLKIPGQWIYDWAGAQRWLKTTLSPEHVFRIVRQAGGYVILFRGDQNSLTVQPFSGRIQTINNNLKQAFDPHGILNLQRQVVGA